MVIATIHNKFRDLSDTEQKIASYVISNPQKVTHMTVKELADVCGTVPSAVIRFCKSIDLDGFSNLKITLAQEMGGDSNFSYVELPAFHASDMPEDVFKKVFSSGIKTLQDTLNMLDMKKMEEIAHILLKANKIYIFGIGTSSVIAIDAQYRFTQFGLQAMACTDMLFMNVAAANMKTDDVALCISHGGRTKAVVDAMRRAKHAGATAVSITSFSGSILARESDYTVCVFSDEENYPVEAVSARVAHLCLIDAFMMTIATLNYDQFTNHIANRNQILNEIRY